MGGGIKTGIESGTGSRCMTDLGYIGTDDWTERIEPGIRLNGTGSLSAEWERNTEIKTNLVL